MTPHVPRLSTAILSVVALLLLVLAIVEVRSVRQQDEDSAMRREALSVAKRQVTDLTTLDADRVEEQVERMIGRTTGEFREQFKAMTQTLTDVVQQGEVTATGSVVESGIVALSDRRAEAIVAATASVRNTRSKKPKARSYRLAVSLERTGDTWLVSGMEFVA